MQVSSLSACPCIRANNKVLSLRRSRWTVMVGQRSVQLVLRGCARTQLRAIVCRSQVAAAWQEQTEQVSNERSSRNASQSELDTTKLGSSRHLSSLTMQAGEVHPIDGSECYLRLSWAHGFDLLTALARAKNSAPNKLMSPGLLPTNPVIVHASM